VKKLTFVHKDWCREGNCPTVYLTESGDLALHGDLVTDPEGVKDASARGR
jgi:hypothetical protein